jgi:hypothetical protein
MRFVVRCTQCGRRAIAALPQGSPPFEEFRGQALFDVAWACETGCHGDGEWGPLFVDVTTLATPAPPFTTEPDV